MNYHRLWIVALVWLWGVGALGVPLGGLVDLEGRPAELSHKKDLELVVFWATWCPDCKVHLRKKLPELNQSARVAVVTVNTDRSLERARSYVKRKNIQLPVFRDPSRSLRKSLKVFSVPHWAVYKRKGQGWDLLDSSPAFNWDRIRKVLQIPVAE